MLAELQHISKYYEQPGGPGMNLILDDINFSIPDTGSIAIVGPSGSGKSTLLHILGTLDTPTAGKVILDDREVASMDEPDLAHLRNRFIGYIFQLHYLLPQLTLLENILLPVLPRKERSVQKAAKERAETLIVRVGLKEQIHHRPAQLSVGERQRAAVVRALINQPMLVLADEPTGSLDTENANMLGQLLYEINREQKTALVIVTHSVELAGRMDSIYRLGSGKLKMIKEI